KNQKFSLYPPTETILSLCVLYVFCNICSISLLLIVQHLSTDSCSSNNFDSSTLYRRVYFLIHRFHRDSFYTTDKCSMHYCVMLMFTYFLYLILYGFICSIFNSISLYLFFLLLF